MVSLTRFSFGESPVSSAKLNAVIDTLTGAANTPVSLTGGNDPINYSLTLRNQDPAGKGLIAYAANGSTVLLQVQNSGVSASAAGGAAAPVVTTTDAQTLSNKSFSNAVSISAGGLTVTGGATVAGGLTVSSGGTSITGSSTITATSGSALQVNGAASAYALAVSGANSSGNSFGLSIQAGFTSADIALNVLNRGGGTTLLSVDGVGTTRANAGGDVILGKGNIGNTDLVGYLYVPSGGGSPTGSAPTNSGLGWAPMRYDPSTHKLWVYDGGWKGVVLS